MFARGSTRENGIEENRTESEAEDRDVELLLSLQLLLLRVRISGGDREEASAAVWEDRKGAS